MIALLLSEPNSDSIVETFLHDGRLKGRSGFAYPVWDDSQRQTVDSS